MSHCVIPGRYRAATSSSRAGWTRLDDPARGEGSVISHATRAGAIGRLNDLSAPSLQTLYGGSGNAYQLGRGYIAPFRRDPNRCTPCDK